MARSSSRKTRARTVQPKAATGDSLSSGHGAVPRGAGGGRGGRGRDPVWTEGYDVAAARAANRAAALPEPPRGRRRGRATSTPTGSRSGSTGRRAPTRAWSCTCTAAASSSTTSTSTTGRAVGSPTGSAWRCSASTTGWPPEHRFPAAPDDVDTVLGVARPRGRRARAAAGRRTSTATAPAATSRWSPRCATRAGSGPRCCIYPFLDPTAGFDVLRARRRRGFDPREAPWYWQQYAADDGRPRPTLTWRRCSPTGSARCHRRWS